jgi:hypothetical protein
MRTAQVAHSGRFLVRLALELAFDRFAQRPGCVRKAAGSNAPDRRSMFTRHRKYIGGLALSA